MKRLRPSVRFVLMIMIKNIILYEGKRERVTETERERDRDRERQRQRESQVKISRWEGGYLTILILEKGCL
jgi:hypothetical protein